MLITSSSGCGEKITTRLGKIVSVVRRMSPGRFFSSGLPPGQPVIVSCSLRKTSMLMLYAGPRSASRSCRPASL